MPRKVLISFGSEGYEKTLLALKGNALSYFDEVIAYSPSDITQEFYEANKEILSQKRGFGYWLWKPYFILRTLNSLNEGDFCFYTDATVKFIAPIDPLLPLCQANEGIMLFNNGGHLNKQWTKMDCFNLMGCHNYKYFNGQHLNAAFQLYQKNENSILFVKQYLEYCQNACILTDIPNITLTEGPLLADFIDHRHDQSVLSLLALKKKIFTFRDLSQWGNGIEDDSSPYSQIIHHHRQKL